MAEGGGGGGEDQSPVIAKELSAQVCIEATSVSASTASWVGLDTLS